MMWRFYLECLLGAAGFLLLAAGFLAASEKNIHALEKLTRNRWIGVILGLPALIVCVPYAAVVSPDFLQPFLWPLAIVLPICCFFSIDFYAARSIAGWMILFAYDLVHDCYELKIAGAAVFTIAAWCFGFAGIWISGKPCSLRDWFRASAKSKWWKRGCTAASLAAALAALGAAAMKFFN